MAQKIMLNFKLILLGDSNTGKTAIVNQYIYHTFTNTKATTGIDFFTKMFEIDDFIVKLNIFDTAGQERYLAMTKSYFRGTNAVLFTYSLTEKQSFLNLPIWIKKFQDEAGTDAMKIAVGTKKDIKSQRDVKPQKAERKNSFPQRLNKDEIKNSSPIKNLQEPQLKPQQPLQQSTQDNTITEEEMGNFMKTYGLTFSFETSALLNQNIDEVFEEICKYLILKEMNRNTKNEEKGLNRSRVETQFENSRRKTNETDDQRYYLQQKQTQTTNNKKSCC